MRLRTVVDALVRIAEHAGDTASFLEEATDTVMELTRATGAVVLMASDDVSLTVACARRQMAEVGAEDFDRGQTLARACLRSHKVLHSDVTRGDDRIAGSARADHQLQSLIAMPLRYGDAVLGVLEVCSSVTQAFDDIDVQAVALVGNALGGALGRQVALDEHARLLVRLEGALKATQAKARWYEDAALYDALTGLPNRAHFQARLEEVCLAHQGDRNGFALLFLDLDGFKAINDDYGHATGDAVLRETAIALKGCLRDADLIARLGGDEFVVLLPSLRDAEHDMQAISATIQGALGRPRTINGVGLCIRTSVGWVAYDGESDAGAVLAAADAAMYEHKKSRRPK
ncbi:MAG: diguanylate cyclase domain-containing protein [Lysobacter sp.]